MKTKENRLELMEKGEIGSTLIILGLPMVISMLVMALYNVVDTFFVSSLGTEQSAAVAIAFPISLYFSGLGLTFGVGGSTFISRLLGQKKKYEANIVAAVALFTTFGISMLLSLIITLNIKSVLGFMGATASVMPYALKYANIFVFSMFFAGINVSVGNIAIAQGESRITFYAMVTGAIFNMVLDPICIYTMNMGIKGAGIATFISQILTSVIYIIFFTGKRTVIKFKFSNFKPSLNIYMEILKVGISMLLLQLLTGFSMSLIARKSSYYGKEAISAMGIVLRIVTLGTNVIFGFMKGYQPFVGYNYGAKNYKRVLEITKKAIKYTTIYAIIWMGIVTVFAPRIMKFMIEDPRVVELGVKALRLNTAMFFSFGFQFTFATLYLAMGKALVGGVLNIARQGLFLIPIILILSRIYGLHGIMIAQAATDIITTLITIPLALDIIKKLKPSSRGNINV